MIAKRKDAPERSKRLVEHHSPQRLLRKPVELPAGVLVSAEKKNGRILIRVESPAGER